MAHPLSLSLFPDLSPPVAETPAREPRHVVTQLWMAVHFPRLALEALQVSPQALTPIALIDHTGQKGFVWDCTEGAARRGVQPGQLITSALALVPELKVIERDTTIERGALIRLASTGQTFTPTVSLEHPAALLLEVEGSAHLFGGILDILQNARRVYLSEGFTATTALAPTPIAALWLARAGLELAVTDCRDLRSVLGRIPVEKLSWSKDIHDALTRLGIRELTDVFRLPRDGLAKRFSKEFLRTLDRALGVSPDPRATWQRPKQCRLKRELPGEFTLMAHMLPYIQEMVTALGDELRCHDAAVNRLKLVFRHWHQPATRIIVGSALPCRQSAHWMRLVQERLTTFNVAAPVHELQLMTGTFMPYSATSLDLLGGEINRTESIQCLVDLLRSRLGQQAVFGLRATPDFRPEQASQSVAPGDTSSHLRGGLSRPVHLVQAPVPLSLENGRPRHCGAELTLLAGPERIEGGWWSEEHWTRDYYQAVSNRGERLWIFREGTRWFLHGLYA